MACKAKVEVYSRIVGYYRPIQQWNKGKKAEYFDRKPFDVDTAFRQFDIQKTLSTNKALNEKAS